MITTEDIASGLEITAKLMELHNENPFKVKAMNSAAYKLSKTRIDLSNQTLEELTKIEGIGKSLAEKIMEFISSGTTKELRDLTANTPPGVIEMLGIKGLGPKKVRQLWIELELESVTDLLYACHENRLVDLKGFGSKTQSAIIQNIEFKLKNTGWFHYAFAEKIGLEIIESVKAYTDLVCFTGAMLRRCEIIEEIDILIGDETVDLDEFYSEKIPINFIQVNPSVYYRRLVETSSTKEHLNGINFSKLAPKLYNSEREVYENLNIQFCEPELREGVFELEKAKTFQLPKLIEMTDLKGILHNHSTYSDGMNSLEEMAIYCKQLGYQYLGICDHSQSAFYAGGLKPETILLQHQEIEKLNQQLFPFKIFKGIESDILANGNLDYEESVLKSFDFIVASIHSNLKMDEEKATSRLIKAIENPYTTILGHPTGRLLLGRPGYPINHKKVIDACAANQVVIELNAHPYRLDLDWRLIPYCLEKNVMISINPDAHQLMGYHDMRYGTLVARKGLLSKESCLNAMDLPTLETFLSKKNRL
ncbi:MAG: polymerase/3-5 exonuclease PolX [Bacteroidota bacterium]|jgi:DNA polymerase (family 10)|nr:polymerase/3-5 exonuclease PolX [Bacteroidota bacterium]